MSFDFTGLAETLKEVETNEQAEEKHHDHQLPPSPLIGKTDELLLELNVKQTDPMLEHKFKCRRCKKPEKSKGYFEKQEIKQKQIKKQRKNK